MCIYIYICVYIYICIYIYVYINICVYIYIYIYHINIYICVYFYICILYMFLYILAFLCTHVYMCMCSIEDPASPWEWHILRTKPFRSKPWPLWGKPFFPAKGVPTWPENCDSQNVFWWSRTPVVTEIFLSVNFESWLVWQILTQQNSDQWKHIDWWASCTGPENAPSPFFPSSIGPVPTPGQDWPGVPAENAGGHFQLQCDDAPGV